MNVNKHTIAEEAVLERRKVGKTKGKRGKLKEKNIERRKVIKKETKHMKPSR